jgi:hypothetical protein
MRTAKVLEHSPGCARRTGIARPDPKPEWRNPNTREGDHGREESAEGDRARGQPGEADRQCDAAAGDRHNAGPKRESVRPGHPNANLLGHVAQHVGRDSTGLPEEVHHDRIELGYRVSARILDFPDALVCVRFFSGHRGSLPSDASDRTLRHQARRTPNDQKAAIAMCRRA